MTSNESLLGASRLGKVTEIQAVVVRRLHWTVNETPTDATVDVEPDSTFNIGHGKSGNILRYQVNSIVTGKVPAGELYRMEVTHEAFFSIPEGFETNDEDLAAFGSISVFFMVFPYIRETLQGLTVNAGVPVLLLKPFKLPVNPADVGLPATPAPPVASELSPPASS